MRLVLFVIAALIGIAKLCGMCYDKGYDRHLSEIAKRDTYLKEKGYEYAKVDRILPEGYELVKCVECEGSGELSYIVDMPADTEMGPCYECGGLGMWLCKKEEA